MMPKKESEIIDIKVVSNNHPQDHLEIEKKTDSDIMLDIHIDVPSKSLRFYGSGLESNWDGHLHMQGPLNDPRLNGTLNASTGHFIIAGKKLTFINGYFLFENTLDPYIYVLTDANAANIDAKVIYHGPLSNATLDMISVPTLPKEEVLAQILFSKSANQIKSPSQAIQLADAIAIFNGKEMLTAFLDKVRQFGVDEIGIKEDPTNSLFTKLPSTPDPGVFSIIKNLGERLFVRGDRILSLETPDSKTRGVLGIKIIPDLSLEIIGEKQDQTPAMDYGIGLEWKKDF
jgi:hypothetical protein